jgi:hypothetical protein
MGCIPDNFAIKPVNDGTVRANQTCSVLGLGDIASLKIELSDRVLGALRLLNRRCGHSGNTGRVFLETL